MLEQRLQGCCEDSQARTSIQQKLQGVNDPEVIEEIAKEAGFRNSSEELKEAQSELSDEQLQNVAGGILFTFTFPTIG